MKTRQIHFIKWCLKLHLHDPTLASLDMDHRNFIMACFTVSLTSNETIFCKTIKSCTVSLYLSDAAKLSILSKLPDPTKNKFNQRSQYISNVLAEHKRWESMPNRREPLTFAMVQQAQINLTKNGTSSFNDSLPQALGDWFLIGLVTGIRKSEWCQDRSHSSKKDITRNIDGSSSAFILSDFTFENKRGVRRDNSRSTSINDAEIVKIRWRFQKNNDNGQVLTYTANNTNPQFCPVRAAMRIRARAIYLRVPPNLPIAVYMTPRGSSEYIDDAHVCSELRLLASQVYNITDKDELKRFTCHSFRVGACVLLHEANKAPDFIKFRIRWKSDSYLMYLRNTPKLAHQHNSAIDMALEF